MLNQNNRSQTNLRNHKKYFALIRPQQWLKNSFVFVGLLFGHFYSDSTLIIQVTTVAISFCLIASSVYIINDLFDRALDRQHPTKSMRPLASGVISTKSAFGILIFFIPLGLILAAWVSSKVLLIIVLYILLNVLYSVWLKHIVILDVFCIAAGFMLRILAGTVGVDITPSNWLLLCGLMLTLFLGFAKRRAELMILSAVKHRKVLAHYTFALLDNMISITAMGTVITYSLYTVDPMTMKIHGTNKLIFTVPFVMYALFRYLYLLHKQQHGENPAIDLFKDIHIIISVIGWLALTLAFIL